MGRIVEQLSGIGEIFEEGKQIGLARYSITVYQKTHTAGGCGASQEIDAFGRSLAPSIPRTP